MTTRTGRFHLAAIIFAALGLGACTSEGDRRHTDGAGISVSLEASEETRSAVGVVGWHVSPISDETMLVTGLGENGDQVATFTIHSTATEFVLEAEGDAGGRIAVTKQGELIENTLDDTTILTRFHADGLLELEAAGFRDAGGCAADLAGAGLDCGKFLLIKNPFLGLKCGVSLVGAGLSCYEAYKEWAEETKGGMEEGGQQEGGQAEGGQDDGGGSDGGGYEDGGGSDGGGYEDGGGSDGGGYEDGGGSDGGGYEDGGGSDGGGYEDGGGSDGGGEAGGYGEGDGGYGEGDGGYGGEGGYGEGGYGYAPIDARGRFAPTGGAIPADGAVISAFGQGGTSRTAVRPGVWNLAAAR